MDKLITKEYPSLTLNFSPTKRRSTGFLPADRPRSISRIMDLIFIVGILVGIFLLALIAFPERFVPDLPTKTKRVGASYWGRYAGEEATDEEDEKTIEVKTVKKKLRIVGGSTTYAQGRGISFRGSS